MTAPACLGADPGLFFPEVEADAVPDDVAALCAGCGARDACLASAVARREVGYWAGTTTLQRRALVPSVPRRRFDPAPLLALAERLAADDQLQPDHPNRAPDLGSDGRVADVLGVERSTVSKWRAGTRRLTHEGADVLATRLGVHPVVLWADFCVCDPQPPALFDPDEGVA